MSAIPRMCSFSACGSLPSVTVEPCTDGLERPRLWFGAGHGISPVLLQVLAKHRHHRGPRLPVGAGVVGELRHAVLGGIGVRETVLGARVADDAEVGARGLHLALELRDL